MASEGEKKGKMTADKAREDGVEAQNTTREEIAEKLSGLDQTRSLRLIGLLPAEFPPDQFNQKVISLMSDRFLLIRGFVVESITRIAQEDVLNAILQFRFPVHRNLILSQKNKIESPFGLSADVQTPQPLPIKGKQMETSPTQTQDSAETPSENPDPQPKPRQDDFEAQKKQEDDGSNKLDQTLELEGLNLQLQDEVEEEELKTTHLMLPQQKKLVVKMPPALEKETPAEEDAVWDSVTLESDEVELVPQFHWKSNGIPTISVQHVSMVDVVNPFVYQAMQMAKSVDLFFFKPEEALTAVEAKSSNVLSCGQLTLNYSSFTQAVAAAKHLLAVKTPSNRQPLKIFFPKDKESEQLRELLKKKQKEMEVPAEAAQALLIRGVAADCTEDEVREELRYIARSVEFWVDQDEQGRRNALVTFSDVETVILSHIVQPKLNLGPRNSQGKRSPCFVFHMKDMVFCNGNYSTNDELQAMLKVISKESHEKKETDEKNKEAITKDEKGEETKIKSETGSELTSKQTDDKHHWKTPEEERTTLRQKRRTRWDEEPPYKKLATESRQSLEEEDLHPSSQPASLTGLRGFKSRPELMIDQHNLGEKASALEEKSLESSEPFEKPFDLRMEKKPITVVFGSHWVLVVLWMHAAEIWNIRDRAAGSVPVLISRIQSEYDQFYEAAAVCDQQTIAPEAQSRLYILVESCNRWSVLVINLNTGVPVRNDHLRVFTDKNILNGRIACSLTNAVAFVALNCATNNQQPCELWRLASDMKLKGFTQNPILSVQSLAVLCPQKGVSLVATISQSELTAINLFRISSAGIQPLGKISSTNGFNGFFWVRSPPSCLWVRECQKMSKWEVGCSGEVRLVQSAKVDAEMGAVVGSIGGRFVTGNTAYDRMVEGQRFKVGVYLFREIYNGFFVPVPC